MMDGITILISILSSVGISGLLVAGLIFLAKTWIGERIRRDIQHEYDTRLQSFRHENNTQLESHKSALAAHRDAEVEKVKADLRIVAMKREVRFQGLYEQSAKAVAKIYARLQRLQNAMNDYASPVLYVSRIRADVGSSGTEQGEVLNAFNELHRCFSERRIFVPPHMVDIVEELEKLIVDKHGKCFSELMKLDVWKAHLIGHTQFVENFGRPMFGDKLDEILQSKGPPVDPREYMKQFRDVDERIESRFRELEVEFRKLLGFELPDKQADNTAEAPKA